MACALHPSAHAWGFALLQLVMRNALSDSGLKHPNSSCSTSEYIGPNSQRLEFRHPRITAPKHPRPIGSACSAHEPQPGRLGAKDLSTQTPAVRHPTTSNRTARAWGHVLSNGVMTSHHPLADQAASCSTSTGSSSASNSMGLLTLSGAACAFSRTATGM